ncbi:unnamed protein product [Clonostachys rosea]|uniref:AMP-dependent synthetase/ligase domain-containing protein n=1 Tax=Bionectria ochroleuca TaxID=29856 RepID=A0ABY6U6G2_BIOOC|nr:unnamed protein product [Clonostachys rosea]
MPIQSRWAISVPEVSLPEWVFGSSFNILPDFKVFLDADQPDTNYLTFSDFRLISKRVALGLQNAGLRPGDRVLFYAGNSIYFPIIFMGIIMAGGIFTGASPLFGPAELGYQLRDSGACFLVAQDSRIKVALEAAAKVGLSARRVYCFDGSFPPTTENTSRPRDVKHWSQLLAGPVEANRFHWVEPANPREATCCLNYSSGTTGPPKGVEITHYSYVANGEAYTSMEMKKHSSRSQVGANTSICFIPMFHAAAQTTFAVNNPKMRITTAVMASYKLDKLLSHVEKFKVTTLVVVPSVVLELSRSSLTTKYDLTGVEDIICGTAPLAPDLAREVERKLWPNGSNFITQGWGMTELTCSGALWSSDDKEKSSAVGELVPNASIRIKDGDEEIFEPNKPGELWFSGPTVMKGYWQNPNATKATIVEEKGIRWLKTGDIGYVDKYGPGAKIHIVDRAKELIKVRGFQVSPSELEGVLLSRADIVDAAVVGILVNSEEVPRAYVVRNSSVTEQEIMEWMESRVAKYKRLRGGVAFVHTIPRTQSGKIIRRHLREIASQQQAPLKAKIV